MNRVFQYIFFSLTVVFFATWIWFPKNENSKNISENVKLSLREVGHQLLLANNDSTSLVHPIIRTARHTYQLSFQSELSIEPDSLVTIIKKSIRKNDLTNRYLVEVLQCNNQQVAYSYRVIQESDKSIIPCKGRKLPETCYKIEVKFNAVEQGILTSTFFRNAFITSLLITLGGFFWKRKNNRESIKEIIFEHQKNENYISIGIFQFYKNQNKLIREAVEINLSKKECELLAILASQPNQVVKRDELTKRVWEDHGVIVGRSLDTYISKLRKKLKEDASIKITNVHGVGYKLEI